ncbi:unnamed protein product [Alopecurus aequalis]
MPPASTSVVTTASSMSSSSDISLPSSPSPSPSPTRDPYAFASSDEISAAPPARKKKPRNWDAPLGVPRNWPAADELALLEAVAALKEQHGQLPSRHDLTAALAGRLPHYSADQIGTRMGSLRQRYDGSVRRLRRGTVPVTDDDVRVFRLSKRIWEGAPKRGRRPPHPERRAFEELQRMYPCLADQVVAVDARCGTPGLMRSAFERMGDEQAAQLEAKAKRQLVAELKVEQRRKELRSLVTKAILDDMQ